MASFERAAGELRWAVEEAKRHGLQLRIEPHIQSVTWTPELAVEMCRRVPGLSLTVDHSHFVFHGIPYEQIAVMHPYGTHWHARQARPGEVQSRFQDGIIPFDRILSDLTDRGYDGVLCLEYVHGEWMAQDRVDCVTETIRLRDQLLSLLAP
jgi:sugar phosphate isomerase/epimerase